MSSAPRRDPQQARSRARVDAILDAADAVFLEMSYAEATTNHVAARAGTSIGSLYRFFPNKEALLVALAERYGDRMREIAVALADPTAAERTLEERVSAGIETFNAFLLANPGFRTVIEQAQNPALQAGRRDHQQAMAGIIGAQQARLHPGLPEDEQRVVALVTETVLGALQMLSLSGDETLRRAVLEEAKRMVSGYLRARLGG